MTGKLQDFLTDRLPWECIEGNAFSDNEMITEAIVIVRVIKVDEIDHHGDMPERTQMFVSSGCGLTMAKGMLVDTEERIAFDAATAYYPEGEDDSDGST